MKILLLSTIILCISSLLSFGQIKQSQAVDSIFLEWNKPNTPGCALGIIKEGELIYAKGYGLANMEYDIPNSATSVYRIGSTSKQFTAACIMLLVEQGRLTLGNTLNDYFSNFPAYAKSITIRHLLNHTSGIRDYLTIAYLKDYRGDDYYEDSDIMKWLVSQSDLNFNPGDEFLYSNSLLGQIVNQVTGMSMANFAQKEIFKPLSMSNTHFHNDHTQIVKNRASGYLPSDNDSYIISMTNLDMIGDGGIFTTIIDIKKWDDAYYNSNVLSREFWNMMTKQGVLNSGDKIEYASGLNVRNYKGLKTISHGGAFVGFRAELIRFPEHRFSVAVFTNRGDANPTGMAYQIADIFLEEYFANDEVERTNNNEIKEQTLIHLKTKELENYAGHYWNDAGSYSRKIYVKNDTLRYYRNETNESALVAVSKNEFKMINVRGDIRVTFDKNEQGNYIMSFIANGGDPIVSKVYQPKAHTIEELADFAGVYYSKELDINYALQLENNLLMLYINDTKISPLKSIMGDLLTNNAYGNFQFSTDDSGRFSSFRLGRGRVKNLIFEKE